MNEIILKRVGRLKKDTGCTCVQKSIFSFCSGLANQSGKSKKKGGGSQGGKWLQNKFELKSLSLSRTYTYTYTRALRSVIIVSL